VDTGDISQLAKSDPFKTNYKLNPVSRTTIQTTPSQNAISAATTHFQIRIFPLADKPDTMTQVKLRASDQQHCR